MGGYSKDVVLDTGTKREKVGRFLLVAGIAMMANAVFLSLVTVVVSTLIAPLDFSAYMHIKLYQPMDRVASLFICLAGACLLVSLALYMPRKKALLALGVGAALFLFDVLVCFVPPDPEGLQVDQLAERHRYRKIHPDPKTEFEQIENRLIEQNAKATPQ